MTIPFGRRRLTLTVAVTRAHPRSWEDAGPAIGATDAELASLARRQAVDIYRPQWEGLRLVYGGTRRP